MDQMFNVNIVRSPCRSCYKEVELEFGYDGKCKTCQECEYNIAIQLLKKILFYNEGCKLCRNRVNLGDGFYDCKKYEQLECNSDNYVIDWDKTLKEYNNLNSKV